MKRSSIKLAICVMFVLSYLIVLAPGVRSYPPFLKKAKELGLPANDCSYCHVNASGGQPYGERAKWLVAEKEKRAAEAVDVAWLKEYAGAGKTSDEPADKPTDKPADGSADKPADKPADGSADKPTDKPADKPADKPGANNRR